MDDADFLRRATAEDLAGAEAIGVGGGELVGVQTIYGWHTAEEDRFVRALEARTGLRQYTGEALALLSKAREWLAAGWSAEATKAHVAAYGSWQPRLQHFLAKMKPAERAELMALVALGVDELAGR
jgi:hypothetical protein